MNGNVKIVVSEPEDSSFVNVSMEETTKTKEKIETEESSKVEDKISLHEVVTEHFVCMPAEDVLTCSEAEEAVIESLEAAVAEPQFAIDTYHRKQQNNRLGNADPR